MGDLGPLETDWILRKSVEILGDGSEPWSRLLPRLNLKWAIVTCAWGLSLLLAPSGQQLEALSLESVHSYALKNNILAQLRVCVVQRSYF